MRKLLFIALFFFVLPLIASAQSFTRNLYVGLSGPDVAELQQKLRDLGFYAYPSVTGWYGPVTAQAVSRFQQAYAADILIPNGLAAPTGTFGPATRAKLLALSGSQPQAASAVPASGGGSAASSDPGCPAGFSYSFLTGQPCARVSVPSSASSRVSQSTAPSRTSRSGGSRASARSDSAQGNANPSSNSNSSGNSSSSNNSSSSSNSNTTPQPPARPGTIIPAGPGFSGPTPQPAAVGTGQGSDAKAIARWDVVPYQTFDSTFNIGVVAFHMSDIDRVEFSANGGEWISISRPTRNPQTDVVEYWATLRAQDFPDGPIEVRAVAYPKQGIPRVLQGMAMQENGEQSLMLYANHNKTLQNIAVYVSPSGSDAVGNGTPEQPYASLSKAAYAIKQLSSAATSDGGIIYLLPGSHVYGTATFPLRTTADRRWLTIMPAPGIRQEQVRLVRYGSTSGLNIKLVHLKDLQIIPDSALGVVTTGSTIQGELWLDNVKAVAGAGGGFWGGWQKMYETDSSVSGVNNAFRSFDIVRSSSVRNIKEDALTNSKLIINTDVDGIDPGASSLHPDILAYEGGTNLIAYGINATNAKAQGLFTTSIKDMAVVDVYMNNTVNDIPNAGIVFHLLGSHEHVVVMDSRFVGRAHWRTDFRDPFVAKNVIVESTVFVPGPVPVPYPIEGVTYRNMQLPNTTAPQSPAVTNPPSNNSSQPSGNNPPSTVDATSPGNIAQGLLLHYAFDNSVQDQSGNNKHGTLVGNPAYAAGKNGSALQLDGIDDMVTFSSVGAGMENTVAFWVKTTDTDWAATGKSNSAAMRVGGTAAAIMYATVSGTASIPHGGLGSEWVHIAVTRSGTEMRLYKNGSLVNSGSLSANDQYQADRIGARSNGSYLNGLLDDLRIYSRALSAGEVQALYNQ